MFMNCVFYTQANGNKKLPYCALSYNFFRLIDNLFNNLLYDLRSLIVRTCPCHLLRLFW